MRLQLSMSTITITEILDDLRAADEVTRRFERRYWLSSADFYELYSQGLLDDGEHTEDCAGLIRIAPPEPALTTMPR